MTKIAGSGSESLPSTDGYRKKFTNTVSFLFQIPPYRTYLPVLRIRIRIHRIHMYLGLLDPDPDPLVTSMDPDPDPSIIMQN
jgi:hypothetical protein